MGMHEDGPWAMGQGEGAGAMEGWPTRSVRRLASSEEVPLGRGRADHSARFHYRLIYSTHDCTLEL